MQSAIASGAFASIADEHRPRRVDDRFAGRHDPIYEADAKRLGGVDHLAGEQELEGASLADESREPLRSAVAWHDAELHFGLAELRADSDATRT